MKVGIIGAGVMGSGIALAFAANEEYEVVLCDVQREYADTAKQRLEKKLRAQAAKGKISEEQAEKTIGRITTGTIDGVRECGFVLEAAYEDMSLKKELFGKLKELCGEDTIFVSNTSSLSITEMGQKAGVEVVGMHFFNPADAMKLVEVIAGENTPAGTVDTVTRIAADIGKTPVRVQEAPGFVVNRILVPMINEAVNVLAEQTACAEDIDTAMRLGANHPMGPLALGDLIGLDVCLAVMEVLHMELGEDKYRPHPLLRKMVRAGKLGRKSGAGFHAYNK